MVVSVTGMAIKIPTGPQPNVLLNRYANGI